MELLQGQRSVKLPPELLDCMFSHLGEDVRTMANCSLVSREWSEPARRR